MSAKVRVVLVGCGGISGAWLDTETVQKKVDMVGFVDLNLKAAKERAKQFGVADAVVGKNMSAVLKKTQPDAVFDCTTPNAHCEVSLTALRHGCHVLNEKPMAASLPQAKRMIAAAKKAGTVAAVIQNRRYLTAVRALHRFIEAGKLGKITTVQSNFFIGAHFGGFRDRMQHVLLLDMAIHTFDAARFISGADPVSVYCKEWNPAGSWYDHDASAVAVFEMTNGIIYTYQGSWCSEGFNTSWEAQWRIVCERGTILWDGLSGLAAQVVKSKETGFTSETKNLAIPCKAPKSLTGGHDGVIRDFIRAVHGGATPETTYTDNIKSLAMVQTAVESATEGREIKVKL